MAVFPLRRFSVLRTSQELLIRKTIGCYAAVFVLSLFEPESILSETLGEKVAATLIILTVIVGAIHILILYRNAEVLSVHRTYADALRAWRKL